jgi:hypothetical protein
MSEKEFQPAAKRSVSTGSVARRRDERSFVTRRREEILRTRQEMGVSPASLVSSKKLHCKMGGQGLGFATSGRDMALIRLIYAVARRRREQHESTRQELGGEEPAAPAVRLRGVLQDIKAATVICHLAMKGVRHDDKQSRYQAAHVALACASDAEVAQGHRLQAKLKSKWGQVACLGALRRRSEQVQAADSEWHELLKFSEGDDKCCISFPEVEDLLAVPKEDSTAVSATTHNLDGAESETQSDILRSQTA